MENLTLNTEMPDNAIFSNRNMDHENIYDLSYTASDRTYKLWLGVSDRLIMEKYKINKEDIRFFHTAIIEYEFAPYGLIILVPESYTGTPQEMAIIEHEIGHILSGHSFACSDEETKILREIEADSYIINKNTLKELLNLAIELSETEYSNNVKANYNIRSAKRRLEAIK